MRDSFFGKCARWISCGTKQGRSWPVSAAMHQSGLLQATHVACLCLAQIQSAGHRVAFSFLPKQKSRILLGWKNSEYSTVLNRCLENSTFHATALTSLRPALRFWGLGRSKTGGPITTIYFYFFLWNKLQCTARACTTPSYQIYIYIYDV